MQIVQYSMFITKNLMFFVVVFLYVASMTKVHIYVHLILVLSRRMLSCISVVVSNQSMMRIQVQMVGVSVIAR